MSDIDFFDFEEKICDFPFYNNEYPLSKIGLIALIIAFIIPLISMLFNITNGNVIGLISLILGITAVGIAANGDFSSICKSLKRSDINLIILVVILQFVFAVIINTIEVSILGMNINSNSLSDSLHSIYYYIGTLFELFGEELFKIIGFFIFTYVIYKFTSNRKISVGIAVFLSLTLFGLMHIPVYGNVFHALIVTGYTSIFMMYAYLKTKNIFVSYVAHVIFDYTLVMIHILNTLT